MKKLLSINYYWFCDNIELVYTYVQLFHLDGDNSGKQEQFVSKSSISKIAYISVVVQRKILILATIPFGSNTKRTC